MAKKKVGAWRPRCQRPDVSAGKAPRPSLAGGPLDVSAQGAILDDDRLMLVVRVRDADGQPVTGLKRPTSKWWQMGHFFGGCCPASSVVEIEISPVARGLYHLVQKTWSTVGNGTIPFRAGAEGACAMAHMTFIVQGARGLDL